MTGGIAIVSAACLLVLFWMPRLIGAVQPAAPQPGGDPVAAYRSFLRALERASSLQELEPYLAAVTREQLAEIPDERAADVLARLRESGTPPVGDWEVLGNQQIAGRAYLLLRGRRALGDTAVGLEGTVALVEEGGTWKVERPEPWMEVEVLPADLDPDGKPTLAAPGAGPADRDSVEPTDYRPAAEAAGSGDRGTFSIAFDPAGRYVAVGDTGSGRIRLLELDQLKEVWSAQVPHARGSLSFRPDGGALAILSETGWLPQVLPLLANLKRRAPAAGYFFTTPVLAAAAAALDGRPNWNTVAYHPQRPVLALGAGHRDDEARGAVVIQSGGDELWTSGQSPPPEQWPTTGIPWALAWSPAGDRLAWYQAAAEPGTPVHVKTYPAGEARTFSRPDLVPGRIVIGPDARLAVAGWLGESPGAVVWDMESGKELALLRGIGRVAFGPDGQHVFGVQDAGSMVEAGVADRILVWMVGNPEPAHTIPAFPPDASGPHVVADLAISRNGRLLAAVSETGDVRLWAAK